jgi:hypothetical protein
MNVSTTAAAESSFFTPHALPAAVSHQPTLRTAPVDARHDCERAGSQISKNKQNKEQG